MLETIYIPLLDEGTDVWRPVPVERAADGGLRIVGEMPEDENWAYKPGEIVFAREHHFADGKTAQAAYGVSFGHSATTRLELAPNELIMICNALNEVCNGVGLGSEFETRIGSTLDTARDLLKRLSSLLGE